MQVTGFVGVWMGLGWALRLVCHRGMLAYAYLLIGIPLAVAFQKFVRRQPLRSCWVRDSVAFRLDRVAALMVTVLVIAPMAHLTVDWTKASWGLRLYFAACVVGAIGGGFALRRFTKVAARSLVMCLATAGAYGCGLMLLAAWVRHLKAGVPMISHHHPAAMFGDQFLMLFPSCFVVEEVVFRGVLDSHLHQAQDSRSWLAPKSWLSAAYLSVLWGWWHLPIFSARQFVVVLVSAPLLQLVPGIAFSLFWRRTGNLAVPATVHAFIDAVRNVFLGVPGG